MDAATLTQKASVIDRTGASVAALQSSVLPSPMKMLRAQEQLNKFRALDNVALLDIGLTQQDVDRATLADFMTSPRR